MPSGWRIFVHRQQNGGSSPPKFGDELADQVAVWQAGIHGLAWLRDLVQSGRAVDLGGDGYPFEFSARATDVLPHLIDEPPDANRVWLVADLPGRTTRNPMVIRACEPSEWLVIQAWDES